MSGHVNRYRGRELGTEAMQHFSYSLGGPGTRFPTSSTAAGHDNGRRAG